MRPGERIGADGLVLSGSSDVDQATITGEPLPAAKDPGDEVFAGTSNGTGALRVRVSRAAADAMTFMIVASPCAVVLATMPPLLAAMANAGRHGVLVKSAVVMRRPPMAAHGTVAG